MRCWMPFLTTVLCAGGLGGCAEPWGPMLGADVASVAVFGRSIGDVFASGFTGRDCSIVRLDQGKTYCAERDPPARVAYCTRSLAKVDCWDAPPPGRDLVADAPAPTRVQERYRAAAWPKSLNAMP